MAAAAAFQASHILDWLADAISAGDGDRVLDLACGPGIVMEAIASRGGQVVGIDVTPEMIRLARERLRRAKLMSCAWSVALAERLPFGHVCFTQVVTRLSFHHFADVPVSLAEVRRVLRPKGQLVLADIVSSENPEESALHNSLEKLRDPSHVRMLTRSELMRSLAEARFQVSRSDVWRQSRSFREWAAIASNPGRTEPLEGVMRALARAGQTAGIGLREESGELLFDHNWLLAVAEAN